VRDRRLDFWRGLCLIDMVLVHLVHEGIQFGALGAVIVDYTRFAAGGFVFMAGLAVGLVFLVRGVPGRATAPIVWRRALYLLGVHYGLTGVIIALDVLRGVHAPAADPLGLVRDVLLLREAPAYVDVLPLYVAMLFATPMLFGLLRRGLWPLVAAGSMLLFAWGRHDPEALSPRASVEFPFLLWQSFFVAGVLCSTVIPRLDRGRNAWPAAMVVAWCAFAVVAGLAYGPRFDLFPEPTIVTFVKVPLTGGECLRYLATTLVVVTTSAAAWRLIQRHPATAIVARLGRRSLAVYGAHVFVQMLVIAAATPLWWIGGVQGLVALPAIGALWLVASGIDVWERVGWRPPELRRVLRGWGAPPVGIVAAALLIALAGPIGPAHEQRIDAVLDDAVVDVVADGDVAAPDVDLVDTFEEPPFTPEDEASFEL
jgi:hypothetical protein